MQYIMMSHNKFYNVILKRMINSMVIIFYHVAPYIPRAVMRFLSLPIVVAIYFLRSKYIRAMRENYRVILGDHLTVKQLDKVSLTTLWNFSRYIIDIFYFRGKSHDTIETFLDDISGVAEFEKTLGLGRGAVLLTAHLGNWELGGYFLGQKKLPINIVYFRDRFKRFEIFRSQSRQDMAVKEISIGSGPLSGIPIIKALKRNEIVAMQGDRDFRGDGLEVTFFEKKVTFPSGPVICAMAAKSPVLPVFILSKKKGKYDIIAKPPVFMNGRINDQEDINNNLQTIASIIENMVRAYPDQWYCFYPFFSKLNDNNLVAKSYHDDEETREENFSE